MDIIEVESDVYMYLAVSECDNCLYSHCLLRHTMILGVNIDVIILVGQDFW